MMVKTAVVFAGRNGLDSCELRAAILRIPEVSLRVKQAQKEIDALGGSSFDLHTYIASDDETFLRNINLKSLAAAIVQVGLYERHLKYQRPPEFLVGNGNSDSALAVCLKKISFQELIQNSRFVQGLVPAERPVVPMTRVEQTPQLSGISLTEYEAWAVGEGNASGAGFTPVKLGFMDFRKLFVSLCEEAEIGQFINIGPVNALLSPEARKYGLEEIEILESIEMDPMLGWLWEQRRPMRSAMSH